MKIKDSLISNKSSWWKWIKQAFSAPHHPPSCQRRLIWPRLDGCSRDEAARQGGQRPPVPGRLTGHIWPDGGTGPDEDGSAILSLPPAGDKWPAAKARVIRGQTMRRRVVSGQCWWGFCSVFFPPLGWFWANPHVSMPLTFLVYLGLGENGQDDKLAGIFFSVTSSPNWARSHF